MRKQFAVICMALACIHTVILPFCEYKNSPLDITVGVSETENSENETTNEKKYIKWIDFTPSAQALEDAMKTDIKTYGSKNHIKWTELLALYSSIYGGKFEKYNTSSLSALAEKILSGQKISDLVANKKLFDYYLEAYGAVLGGMLGEFTEITENPDGTQSAESKYGLRVFSPIAEGYYYNDYDDFGASRSYGYKRSHLGHDILGSIGTPIIAVESGYIEHLGWNQYGGWRIGIRSFDGKRYYYYAHLRKGHPYTDLYEGKIVNAGEVIGYLGMTGYSAKEDVNNINIPHLHYGLQIIFDSSQIDGWNQIWIDMYELTKFLSKNRSKVYRTSDSSDFFSKRYYEYPETPD